MTYRLSGYIEKQNHKLILKYLIKSSLKKVSIKQENYCSYPALRWGKFCATSYDKRTDPLKKLNQTYFLLISREFVRNCN